MTKTSRFFGCAAMVLGCTTPHLGAQLADGELRSVGGAPPAWGEVIFVNGINIEATEALSQAEALSQKLSMGVTLCFNDLSRMDIDWLAMLVSKLGDYKTEINRAADTLLPHVTCLIHDGKQVVLVGHSLGGAVVQNAVNELADQLASSSSRFDALSRISVLLVGAAVFAEDHPLTDGFPDGLRGLFSISDARDPVSRWWGDVDEEWFDEAAEGHTFIGSYLRHITEARFEQTGRVMTLGGQTLLECVQRSRQPDERCIRWWVWRMPNQESRRTLNAKLPPDWRDIRWSVEGHPRPESVRWTPMEENQNLLEDGPAGPELHHDARSPWLAVDYIGRIVGSEFAQAGAFWVVARPVEAEETE